MKNNENRFRYLDRVEVVKYGSLISIQRYEKPKENWRLYQDKGTIIVYDMQPELVGETGLIMKPLNKGWSIACIPKKTYFTDEQVVKVTTRQQLESYYLNKNKHDKRKR